MNALKTWYFGLQERERWIVSIGFVAAVVIIVWWSMTRLGNEMATLRTAVDTKQRLLIDVQRLEAQQPSTGPANGRQGTEQTLVVIVDDTARSHGLGSPRTRQNGPNGIDVTIQGASFDALMTWLIALHGTYGIDVETGQLVKAREPGLVNGQLLLRR